MNEFHCVKLVPYVRIVTLALVEEVGYPMLPPPVRVPIFSQDITKTRFSFRAEVDQGKRRSQVFLPFVSSSCYCLPEGAFVPWKGFKFVDTVANDSSLRFRVLGNWIWKRAPPHVFVNFSYQRGTTVRVELQGLASVAPVGVIVQLGITLVEERAAGVKVVIGVAGGPS